MSTIRVTNVQDTSGGNSSTTAEIKNGIAKAWVNFNGQGTVAIRKGFNVSSITDNGVGNYTVNFTNALADANYVWTVGSSAGVSPGGSSYFHHFNGGTLTSSAIQLSAYGTDTTTNTDFLFLTMSIFN